MPLSNTPIPVRDLLHAAKNSLQKAGVQDAFRSAELLLAKVLDVGVEYLWAHPERELLPKQVMSYRHLVLLRKQHMPVSQLLGEKEFYGRKFWVNKFVLSPRPESELLIERAIEFVGKHKKHSRELRAVDVGTGSGILAVSTKAVFPRINMWACDISRAALTVAKQNAKRHDADVVFRESDLLSDIPGKFDLILANLPYVASAQMDTLMPDVSRYEPVIALDGGADGLDLVRALMLQLRSRMHLGAAAFFEFGVGQEQVLTQLAYSLGFVDVKIYKDLSQRPRVLAIGI